MASHVLKVQPPYFDALLDGSKTFEVRRNDRAYQKGDTVVLTAYDGDYRDPAHARSIRRTITFVYSGDPRFGPWPDGVVVLALGPATDDGTGEVTNR